MYSVRMRLVISLPSLFLATGSRICSPVLRSPSQPLSDSVNPSRWRKPSPATLSPEPPTAHVAAIRHIVQQRAVRPGHVDGLADPEVHVVLDHAAGVAWGELDVGDHLVQGIVRIDLAAGYPP